MSTGKAGPAHTSGRRIALVIDRLAGRGGGAERVLTETANALAGRGHLVEIITHERSRAEPFYPLQPGVMLTRLRPPRPVWRVPLDKMRGPLEWYGHHLPGIDQLAWFSRHGGFWRRLVPYLAATRPDAAAGFLPPAFTALALASSRLRAQGIVVPTLASTHNAPVQDFLNPERWGPGKLDRARRLAGLRGLDRIAVLLPDYRDWHAPELQSRITVLPNAVVPVPTAARARPDNAHRVVAVGRLATVKRHDLLIAAWAGLVAEFPDWRLDIHGEGPLAEALTAQISAAGLTASVTLHGQTFDMGSVYRGAAMLAHPAEFEGFPLAVTEALAHGLPVLGFSDCTGTNALVRDGINGLLVAADSQMSRAVRIRGLAAALRQLMVNPALRAQLGAAGPADMARYAPDAILDRWEALLLGS
jgi:glycosyltransferase involved in cell wall biosynthesis